MAEMSGKILGIEDDPEAAALIAEELNDGGFDDDSTAGTRPNH
jgi:DNA-binding response OmpR family regulator